MHVGLIADRLGTQAGGLETYERELIQGLSENGNGDRFTVFCASQSAAESVASLGPRFDAQVVDAASKITRFSIGLPMALRRSGIDLVHACVFPPLFSPTRLVLTVHDFSPFTHPAFFPPAVRIRFTLMIRRGISASERVICVSESTKADLIRLFRIDPARVSVVHLGVEQHYRPIEDASTLAACRRKYDLPERYILFVGKLTARKNISGILKAYALLRSEYGIDHTLVLAGRRVPPVEADVEQLERSDIGHAVRILGHVAHEDLPALYAGAAVFLFPSHFEGFGLPVLEAMACGTPVVTSDQTSLPEIAGNAAACVSPNDHQAIASAVRDLLVDEAYHSDVRAKGIANASNFSWQRNARKTLEVYRDALRGT